MLSRGQGKRVEPGLCEVKVVCNHIVLIKWVLMSGTSQHCQENAQEMLR